MKTIAPNETCVVGNCPTFVDHDNAIDQSGWVTRFNNTAGFGTTSGSRVTELVLVSRGGQAREWLSDPAFVERPAIQAAHLVTLVFPRSEDPGAECCFDDLARLLTESGKAVSHIEEEDHRLAREALRNLGAASDAAVSSGFIYTYSKLRALAADAPPLQVFAFSFEGWNGHAWKAEEAWFRQQEREGRIRIHPARREGLE
ncbi:hypothetical protein ACQKKX_06770 [Neorhizobium sp. NPDC001467]|uniref:hypothetical protein n=1 Tax=Neorhizobium sp. NPDC001467 TaxID=3390595 RepID=UPI003D084735